jgi:hypothetical protein
VTEPAPLPAKIAAPLEFYTCNDPSCEEDFPEDRFDSFLDDVLKICLWCDLFLFLMLINI